MSLIRSWGAAVFASVCSATGLAIAGPVGDPDSAGPQIGGAKVMAPHVRPGELLLGELNCTACHKATPATSARLPTKRPPTLAQAGKRITPQYLRSFIVSPHAEKAGTTMPDILHGQSNDQKAEVVDGLVHYIGSLGHRPKVPPAQAEAYQLQRGSELYHTVGCVACHPSLPEVTPSATAGSGPGLDAPRITTLADDPSVPIGNLAKKTTVAELTSFLLDPMATRPSGRMPSMNLTQTEATAIATHLLRGQIQGLNDASAGQTKVKGLQFLYIEQASPGGQPSDADGAALDRFASIFPGTLADDDRRKLRVVRRGTVEKFVLRPAGRGNEIGLLFHGIITLPSEAEYSFYTESDDGSRLYIGETLVVNNDGEHGSETRQGTLKLPAGDHPIRVSYYNAGGDKKLVVSYSAPGIAKREIPDTMLSHHAYSMSPTEPEEFLPDPAKIEQGKHHFSTLGCASCHAVDAGSPIAGSPAAKPLADLASSGLAGCLAETPTAAAPNYHLTPAQRAALSAALSDQPNWREPLGAQAQIERTLAALNCYACHARDGIGGPTETRAQAFTSIGQVDLGDEGRLPPHLTGVGNKLRTEWLLAVLTAKGAVRPYMATRMPQFGTENVAHLPALFAKTDAVAEPHGTHQTDPQGIKAGRQLVGVGGLACLSCHSFANHKSLGIPGPDLTVMPRRLKEDWFHRYLLDPASLRPGTRMPSFWPDGKSANTEILGGDPHRQIDAIWDYLSQGRDADVPAGLLQGRLELVATNEPVIYRHFIQGAGSRAIGVGYPERANLAFDANEFRVALLWQGAFIDASKHRTGRGEGFEPPLGVKVLKMPPGPSFAYLTNSHGQWPSKVEKPGIYTMRGYEFDEHRRPIFLYSVGQVAIEDHFEPASDGPTPSFVRTIKLSSKARRKDQSKASLLWFRAASGTKIEQPAPGKPVYLVDEKTTIRLSPPAAAKAIIVTQDGRQELRVPIEPSTKSTTLVQEIIW